MELSKILINGKIFEYEELDFVPGSHVINKIVARENLLLINSVLKNLNITYGLIYGTLLGAIRNRDFIDYDEDTDLYILFEDKDKLFSELFEIERLGFKIARIREGFISFIREHEYIDVYFFVKRNSFFEKQRILENKYIVKAKYLENTSVINFLDIKVPVPIESVKLLRQIYGRNWDVPIKNNFALPNSFLWKIVNLFPSIKKSNIYNKLKTYIYSKSN